MQLFVAPAPRRQPHGGRFRHTWAVASLAVALLSAVLGGCSGPAAPPPGSGKSSNPATLYAKYCAGCHGADGRRGSGNMVLIHAGRLSDAEVEQVIAAGREGMPSWKDRLSATEIAALARYVRQFK